MSSLKKNWVTEAIFIFNELITLALIPVLFIKAKGTLLIKILDILWITCLNLIHLYCLNDLYRYGGGLKFIDFNFPRRMKEGTYSIIYLILIYKCVQTMYVLSELMDRALLIGGAFLSLIFLQRFRDLSKYLPPTVIMGFLTYSTFQNDPMGTLERLLQTKYGKFIFFSPLVFFDIYTIESCEKYFSFDTLEKFTQGGIGLIAGFAISWTFNSFFSQDIGEYFIEKNIFAVVFLYFRLLSFLNSLAWINEKSNEIGKTRYRNLLIYPILLIFLIFGSVASLVDLTTMKAPVENYFFYDSLFSGIILMPFSLFYILEEGLGIELRIFFKMRTVLNLCTMVQTLCSTAPENLRLVSCTVLSVMIYFLYPRIKSFERWKRKEFEKTFREEDVMLDSLLIFSR